MLLFESLSFMLAHLSALSVFLIIAYLFGASTVVVLGGSPSYRDKIFINTALGLGVKILLLFILAALQLFTLACVSAALLGFSFFSLFVLYKKNVLLPSFLFNMSWRGSALVVFGLSMVVLFPLYPPVIWDELSYHLPYAQFYVENEGLAVNPYLRYPLYSHNFNLLYSLGLLFQDDILAHCFHAAAGGLIAIGVVSFSSRFTDVNIGVIAAFIFLLSPIVRMFMKTAYIDLGLSLFVFLAFYALMLFDQEKKKHWLIMCAIALGLAGGTKYLGLTYVPIFMVFIWFMDKKVKSQAIFLGVALLVACPWYVRSAIIAGNPFSPFAADIFGFWVWDFLDLTEQKQELFEYHGLERNIGTFLQLPLNVFRKPESFNADVISAILLLSLWPCVLFFVKFSRVNKFIITFSMVSVVIWFFGAQILRYLLPVFPLLALLTAVLIFNAGKVLCARFLVAKNIAHFLMKPIEKILFFVVLLISAVSITLQLHKNPLPVSAAKRVQYLTDRLDFYSAIDFSLKKTTGKIYQFGFENGFYYGGARLMGDWYGLARYRPLLKSLGRPVAIHQYLVSLNADVFIVNKHREPFNQVGIDSLVNCGFQILYEDDKGIVFDVPLTCK